MSNDITTPHTVGNAGEQTAVKQVSKGLKVKNAEVSKQERGHVKRFYIEYNGHHIGMFHVGIFGNKAVIYAPLFKSTSEDNSELESIWKLD